MSVDSDLSNLEDPGPLVSNHEAVKTLQRAIIDAPRDINIMRMALVRIIREESWRRRLDMHTGQLFTHDDFRKFINDPLPAGLDTSVETIRQFLGEGPERVSFELVLGENSPGPGNPDAGVQPRSEDGTFRITNNVSNTEGEQGSRRTKHGNSIGYATRRLQRERPDLLAKVEAGEMSSNRAMVEAGFRKVPTPLEIMQRAWNKASQEERDLFVQWIGL